MSKTVQRGLNFRALGKSLRSLAQRHNVAGLMPRNSAASLGRMDELIRVIEELHIGFRHLPSLAVWSNFSTDAPIFYGFIPTVLAR